MAELAPREILCKSALTKTGIPGYDFCLNPYVGCTHGCVYCYASFMCRFSGHKEKWGEFLDVKVNFADVLARQLSGRRTRPAGKVTIGSVTDAYQPAEERYGITRASLQVLAEYQLLEVGVLTKSHLVERDIPILRALRVCEVGFTLTTLDGDVAGVLEPGASPPKARLAAAGALIKAGIPVWVFVAPLLPGLTDAERSLTALFQSLRETGVKEILFDHLNPYPAVANRMKTAYRQYFPTALPALEEYLRHPGGYWDEIGALLRSAAAPSKSRAAMDDQ
jgi:DNA repair photolyase